MKSLFSDPKPWIKFSLGNAHIDKPCHGDYFAFMASVLFYSGLFLQLCGIATVGLCLFSGLQIGDYGRIELLQFVGGSFIFYFGNFIKSKAG